MINNQKRKNKKLVKQIIFIILIIVLIVILFFLFNHIYNQLRKKKEFENEILSFSEKNEETVFSINKIIFFSSCDSKNKTSSQTNFTIENLYAYTDIAIFIDNGQKEISSENTITNIKFTKQPELGTGNLYYKNVNNFAKSEIDENNKIENELQFETTSKDEVDLSKPVLYNNCANPITLSYVNQNIKTDYTMTDTQNPITYNGKLLKRCGVSVNSINTSISFDIEIQNNKKQKFRTTIYFDIPYEDEDKSINDGRIVVEKNAKFNFYRYE